MKNFSDEQLKTIYTTSKHTAVIAVQEVVKQQF